MEMKRIGLLLTKSIITIKVLIWINDLLSIHKQAAIYAAVQKGSLNS